MSNEICTPCWQGYTAKRIEELVKEIRAGFPRVDDRLELLDGDGIVVEAELLTRDGHILNFLRKRRDYLATRGVVHCCWKTAACTYRTEHQFCLSDHGLKTPPAAMAPRVLSEFKNLYQQLENPKPRSKPASLFCARTPRTSNREVPHSV
jgi:hypothetical protein